MDEKPKSNEIDFFFMFAWSLLYKDKMSEHQCTINVARLVNENHRLVNENWWKKTMGLLQRLNVEQGYIAMSNNNV